MKTFKLTITEAELRALIDYHLSTHNVLNYSTETSERIHTLTKRLNKDTPEIEGDPKPLRINFPDDYQKEEPAEATAAKEEQPTSW